MSTRIFRITAIVSIGTACLFIAACGKSSSDSGQDDAALKQALQASLLKQFFTWHIPVGDIEVMGGLSSEMENDDWNSRRFTQQFYEKLKTYATTGVLRLEEHPQQSALDVVARMGGRIVSVIPSDEAMRARDTEASNNKEIYIPRGRIESLDIVRNTPYQNPRFSPSEDHRLLVGLLHWRVDKFGSHGGDWSEPLDYKFRAVVRLDPFTKHYILEVADMGNPKQDAWATHNVE